MRLSILVISFLLVTSTLQGKIVFYSTRDGNSEIYVMSSAGSNQTRLTDSTVDEEVDGAPVWSPNGRQIAFVKTLYNRKGEANYEVFVMDADGGNQRRLTHHPAFDGYPDWSPDGAQIAFVSDRDSGEAHDPNIYMMDADGSNVRQITHLKWSGAPKWSPDGKHIAFDGWFGLGHNQQVYVMNPDGTHRWQVSKPIPNTVMYVEGWSPEGRRILYQAAPHGLKTDATAYIATLNAAKSRVVKRERLPLPLKPAVMDLSTITWGADGKSILISLEIGKESDIYRFRLSDDQLVQLTYNPGADYWANEWNPRLPVSPQELAPKRWGEIKSNSHNQRGIGDLSIPPIP